MSAIFTTKGERRDRGEQITGYEQLGKTFDFGQAQAQQQAGAGTQLAGAAGQYYGSLLSGNRAALGAAVAPGAAATNAAYDARKRQLAASGTARGGGVAATNQQMDTQKQAEIDQMLFGARAGAAQQAGQLGMAQEAAGLQGGELANKAAFEHGDLALQSRLGYANQVQKTVGGVEQAIALALMA